MLMLPLASGIAARSFGNPPVKTPAALAESAAKNVRRVTSLCIGFPSLLLLTSYLLLLTFLGPLYLQNHSEERGNLVSFRAPVIFLLCPTRESNSAAANCKVVF